jgi:hypothetical protein
MKRAKYLFVALFAFTSLYAQGTSGSDAKYEYRNLIDFPTAGILQKGQAAVSMNLLPYGSLMTKVEVGVFQNFSFGISYGGENIIGTGKINWYKLPGVNIKARIMDETFVIPALAIGFDSQGKGRYLNDYDRYEIKSPGFYVAASKNFEMLGYLGIHGLVNYSLEREDGDKDLNFAFGVEKTLGSRVSLLIEYNIAFNDNTFKSISSKGNGYLSMGIRYSIGEGFTLGLDLRDLLQNKRITNESADRGVFIEYVSSIFK